MPRLAVILGLLFLPGLLRAQVRSPNPQPMQDDKGTYLGVLFAPIPIDKTLPVSPPGVQVTHVLPDSPAARAGLRRSDIVVEYDGKKVESCDHFAGLIRDDKPDHKVKLALLRDGESINAEATLTLGPALLLPGEAKAAPGGRITVAAKPLPRGEMRVTVAYLSTQGKPQSLIFEGNDKAINDALQDLPARERLLVQQALERVRALNTEKAPLKPDEKPR